MKCIEFINFTETEIESIRMHFRNSSSRERWIEWRHGLSSLISKPDISLINVKELQSIVELKHVANQSSGSAIVLFGVHSEISGIPTVTIDNLIESLASLLTTNYKNFPTEHSFQNDVTCPMPLPTSEISWSDLSSQLRLPSYY